MNMIRLPAFAAALLLATPSFAADAPKEDHVAATGGDIVVHPVGHGSLALTWNGKTIYVDPAPVPGGSKDGAEGFKGFPPADAIVITHEHGDHFDAPTLEKLTGAKTVVIAPKNVAAMMPASVMPKVKVLANGEDATVAGVKIEAVAMYNVTPEKMQFHPKGQGNGYVIEMGGKRIYIAGDTEATPEMKALKNIDMAFLPMNLPYTMTPEIAAEAALAFKPKVVYPYHYGQSDLSIFVRGVASDKNISVRLLKWY